MNPFDGDRYLVIIISIVLLVDDHEIYLHPTYRTDDPGFQIPVEFRPLEVVVVV